MTDQPSGEKHTSRDEASQPRTGVKRPLVPVVLALMAGLIAAAWGVQVPRFWLLAGLSGLLVVLGLLWFLTTPQK